VERLKTVLKSSYNEIVEAFGEDCRLRGLTNKTSKEYQSILRKFLIFLDNGDSTLQEVNTSTLRNFLAHLMDERKLTHKTIKDYFTTLSTFYDYLVIEEQAQRNIILPFRKRYLRRYKDGYDSQERKLISVEEMSGLVNSALDPRDKAIMVLLAKTGVRRGELVRMDVNDIDWVNYSVTLKPTPKRSNRRVFFDDEAALLLRRWLRMRGKLGPQTEALFVNYNDRGRLKRSGVYNSVIKYAERLGLHDMSSSRLEDHFGPHCFRHWFTTHLLRNGMRREYVKELRGDRRSEAIDIYHHIDGEELRKAYLAYVPKLGV
jgi:integrase/recombinase XerD